MHYNKLFCVFPCISHGHKGPVRSFRDAPPAHFTFPIQSFSMLSRQSKLKLKSDVFEVGGYKWRLSLYPKGNLDENGSDHISLYLTMVDTSSLTLGWEVDVEFRLFLYNQARGDYMMLEELSGKRFNETKKKWGFSQFIDLKTFNKASNGYLVNDECVFGAEVFTTHDKINKVECPSTTEKKSDNKFTWKIEDFRELFPCPCHSQVFNVGDFKWMIKLQTLGNENPEASSLSLYLVLVDAEELPPGCSIYVKYSLRVVEQYQGMDFFCEGSDWFSCSNKSCGWQKFMCIMEFLDHEKGFYHDGSCIIEADVSVSRLSNKMP